MKKAISLLLALCMALAMAGCGNTPSTVGSIGNTEIPAGLYLMMQYLNYQTASGYADSEDVSAVLAASFTPDGSDTATTGADFIAAENLKDMEYYAALHDWCDELGVTLSESEIASLDSNLENLWSYSSETYEENGIGESSARLYLEQDYLVDDLLDAVYGSDGTDPVTDEEYSEYMDENCIAAQYLYFPLMSSDYSTIADDDQTQQVLALAQEAANRMNTEDGTTLEALAEEYLPQSFEILDMDTTDLDVSAYVNTNLFTPADFAYYSEDVQNAMNDLEMGKAAAVNMDGAGILVMVRQTPSKLFSVEEEKDSLLEEMKQDELDEALYARGAALEHKLDSSAMNTYSPKNIKD